MITWLPTLESTKMLLTLLLCYLSLTFVHTITFNSLSRKQFHWILVLLLPTNIVQYMAIAPYLYWDVYLFSWHFSVINFICVCCICLASGMSQNRNQYSRKFCLVIRLLRIISSILSFRSDAVHFFTSNSIRSAWFYCFRACFSEFVWSIAKFSHANKEWEREREIKFCYVLLYHLFRLIRVFWKSNFIEIACILFGVECFCMFLWLEFYFSTKTLLRPKLYTHTALFDNGNLLSKHWTQKETECF